MARLRPRSCTLRTRPCTTPSIGAATGWRRHDRRVSALAYARRAGPSPLRLPRISVIIAAPHAPVARLGEGGRCRGHTQNVRPRRRASDHGLGGVIANVLWTFAPPRLDCAEPGSTIWKSKRKPNRENDTCYRPVESAVVDSPRFQAEHRCAPSSRGVTCPVKLADDQLEKVHDRKSAGCPNRPPAGGVWLCRHDSWHGAARRQPSAADPERESEGGSGQHDQYVRRGRSGFELRDGGRERRI